ncbi:hypothetical protein [Salinivibrio sp. SS2]|uniref:hypothetical protein n=1 Tax=Salinivibrio sp. SS2 TaxID=1892894 RepID=UPI00084CA010|nr:hypothetical protein [Salinivibrio sp. DV]ODP98199.1 hypothetical protein BGK46_12360 [Salinivibrio sp. DV]
MSYELLAKNHEDLLGHMADIALMQRVIKNSFQREFDLLNEYELKNSPSEIISHDAFGSHDLVSGKLKKYAFCQTSIAELKKLTLWHKNSQYCWLLVQAYEWFEKFIFDSHKLILREQPKTKALNCSLSFFSSTYTRVKEYEKKNASGIHLKIAVLMIEQLRHQIVHAQGCVNDFDDFSEKIISKSGINNDKPEHRKFFRQFILDNKVYLLERPINDGHYPPRYHDTYTHLVSYLIGYAGLIKEAAEL